MIFTPKDQLPPNMQQYALTKSFDETSARKIVDNFARADQLQIELLDKLPYANIYYPVPVHVIALPDFSFTGWIQGVVISNGEIAAMLTYTKEIGMIFFCKYSSIIFMRTRKDNKFSLYTEGYSENLLSFGDLNDDIVLIDTMLEHFAEKGI